MFPGSWEEVWKNSNKILNFLWQKFRPTIFAVRSFLRVFKGSLKSLRNDRTAKMVNRNLCHKNFKIMLQIRGVHSEDPPFERPPLVFGKITRFHFVLLQESPTLERPPPFESRKSPTRGGLLSEIPWCLRLTLKFISNWCWTFELALRTIFRRSKSCYLTRFR